MTAASSFIFPDKAKLNFFNATDLLNQATYKMSLHTSIWSPNQGTMEVFADVSNEIANGNGYLTGGQALTSVSLTQSGGVVRFTSNPVVWTAAGGSIPAWRYGVLRAIGTINGKVDPIVGYFIGDSSPADVPAVTSGNTLTVTPNASGVMAAA